MRLFTIVFSFLSLATHAQTADSLQFIDLRGDWKVYRDRTLVPYSNQSHASEVIYLGLDRGRYQSNSRLRFSSSRPISLYLNYRLLRHHSSFIEMDLDSLIAEVPGLWLFGIYQSDGFSWLKTEVVSTNSDHAKVDMNLRLPNYYLDFAIIVAVILLVFFVVLMRTNPRLTFDYFNFVRLFSIKEREDSLLNSRISSSANILYYAFSSFAFGFALLTIFHFGAQHIPLAESFMIDSIGSAFWQWLKLSIYVFGVLLLRLILLSVFGSLFNIKDVIVIQFYNFIRLGFFVSTVSFLSCLAFFITRVQSSRPYNTLLEMIVLLLVFWVLLVGLKLLRRSAFRFFHLFSYLCASELIPIVILVKVLNS
ncbi:MAG TPA: DUF4271 domain-containing protein [Cyclobacteriaceae bacterium]